MTSTGYPISTTILFVSNSVMHATASGHYGKKQLGHKDTKELNESKNFEFVLAGQARYWASALRAGVFFLILLSFLSPQQ